jgi:hypothetical protein
MQINKHLSVGPGGTNCRCCFPQDRKGRKLEYRRAKHREAHEALRIEQLNNEENNDQNAV